MARKLPSCFLTSDHGEMMGDHFRVQKQLPWRESLTVPAVVLHPDHPGPRVITSPVELTDFTATILDLARLEPRPALGPASPEFQDRVPCRSLLPLVTGAAASIREVSFSGHNGEWWCVQDATHKLVRWLRAGKMKHSLYALTTDPGEQRDLYNQPAHRPAAERLRDALDTIMSATPPAQLRWAEAHLPPPKPALLRRTKGGFRDARRGDVARPPARRG